MRKTRFKNIITGLQPVQKLRSLRSLWQKLQPRISVRPQLLSLIIIAAILLFYPLGALISENIDTDTDYEIVRQGQRSATIDTMSFLIKREVYDNSWTPALPFIFPASLLDNMPSFQLGLMSSVSRTAKAFAAKLDKIAATKNEKTPLQTAAELLQYPGTIWMFSPTNKLVPAPSSNSQYRRARKQLQNHNALLADGRALLQTTPQNLEYILEQINKDLQKNGRRLEAHIRENSDSFYDGRADNIFYYSRGKLYAYNLLLKALSQDFKDTILRHNAYQPWTSLLKALEDAAALSPAIVRNGRTDSSLAPNHLTAIGFYNNKAVAVLQDIITRLKTPNTDGVQL